MTSDNTDNDNGGEQTAIFTPDSDGDEDWGRGEPVDDSRDGVAEITDDGEDLDIDRDALSELTGDSESDEPHTTGSPDPRGTPVEPDVITPDGESDEPHTTGEAAQTTLSDHYQDNSRGALEELAHVGEFETVGAFDKSGWYSTRRLTDPEDIDAGFTHRGRPQRLGEDLDTILGDVNRTIYALSSYKDPDALETWRRFYFDNGISWEGVGNPLPEYGDIRAIAAFGDIDLHNDLKQQRGELDEDTIDTVEASLDAYVDAFAEIVGGDRDAVHVLDSVGGSYFMTSPAATLPIGRHFEDDEDALERVMREFVNRSNAYLEEAQERIESEIDGCEDVMDPDWCNNKNRKYKAPLSVHKDHEAVVTPIDTDDVTYSVTWLDDVDEETVREAREWAREFTTTQHTDKVEDVVSALWPDYMDGHDSWEGALEAWVEDDRETEDQLDDLNPDRTGSGATIDTGDVTITTNRSDVTRALDSLDIERVAEEYVVHQWTDRVSGLTDRSGTGKRAFIPTWGAGSYESGNANYVNIDVGSWVDSAESDHGTVVELALIGDSDTNWTRGEIADGRDWGRGVEILIRDGFDVPFYLPDAHAAGGQMAHWAVVKAATLLGVVDEDDLITKYTDDGSEYDALPGPVAYNETLDQLDAHGIDHGWDRNLGALDTWREDLEDYVGAGSARSLVEKAGLDDRDPAPSPEEILAVCVVARDAGYTLVDGEVPEAALVAVGRRAGLLTEWELSLPDYHRETALTAFENVERGDLR